MKNIFSIARWRDILNRLSGQGVYPYELAFLLDLPLRKLILSPQKVADQLHLTSQAQVLEIGPGPGYFSDEVARRIPNGQLTLLDIQYEMLHKNRRKLRQAAITNARWVQGSADTLPLTTEVFDVVFLVTVLGEVPEPRACLQAIQPVLRPGGLLSITEMQGDPDALGPEKVQQLAHQCGFTLLEAFSHFKGFMLNFTKAPCSEKGV
jgi:ubiquinone/menaquinone biosynthesis C-methylase UbiE